MFVDRLRENLVVGQLGATVLSGLSGEQTIPRLTSSTSAYWVAEHTDVTRSDLSFDSFSMSPKTVGVESEYSRRMIINASPSIEQMVRNDLADTLATEIDRAAINADGTGNMPTGILATAGLKTIDISSVTWYRCLELVQTLTEDRALRGNLAWLVNPRTLRELRITVKEPSNEQFLVENINELAGYGLFQSNHVPSDAGAGSDESPVIFGNWSDFMIGYWSSVDLLVNPYHQDVYSKGGVLINVLQDLDMAVRHPESFVIGTGPRSVNMTSAMEIRAAVELASHSPGRLTGYAAVFNVASQDLGGFTESILPGAFTRTLKQPDNIMALYDHDQKSILGRHGAGTLKLEEDARGLRFDIELPETTVARDIATLVKRGDVAGASFAFTVPNGGDRWVTEHVNLPHRELMDIDLREITITANPAYLDTSVAKRHLDTCTTPFRLRIAQRYLETV